MSERAWGLLLLLVCLLLVVAWFGGMVAIGAGLLRAGARLIPRRTWREAAARVDRVAVYHSGGSPLMGVEIHYTFTLERPGAPPQPCSGRIIPNEAFDRKEEAESRAIAYRTPGTIKIWYAEECPTLQYLARPRGAWQASKGLLLIALAVLLLFFLALLVWEVRRAQ